MKVNRSIEPLVLALALSVGVLGCKTNPYGVTKLPDNGGGKSHGTTDLGPGSGNTADNNAGSGPSSVDTSGGTPASTTSHTGWPEDRETLAPDTVHFEYDSTVIKSADKAKVSAVAEYLKSNAANAVRVEGHCDERGTDEYNRALGERRAGAIREQLVQMGVDPNRIDTISFGRDKPVDTGHSEAAHAKNRRGEFVVLTPPK
jgi:peptidoglycan-associated lipoprotein